MMTCLEVQVLRSFANMKAHAKALDRLSRRYRDGRRCAADVVDGLRALDAQHRHLECSWLLLDAFRSVCPVPTLLWLWACSRIDVLGVQALRHMLRLAAASPRHMRHLWPRRHAFSATPDGIVALMHESYRFPDWAPEMAEGALRGFLARGGTSRSEHVEHASRSGGHDPLEPSSPLLQQSPIVTSGRLDDHHVFQ